MANADLGIGIAGADELIEDFRINHGPASLELVLVEKASRIELEGTIDITHIDTEDHTYQYFPTPGIDFTHPGILAINTIAQHSIIFINKREEALKIIDIKLSIGIHEKSQIFGNRLKAANQGRAIALVNRMVYDFQIWTSRSNGIQDHASM